MKIVLNYEDFLEVEVLTFCIMSNHFHLLVRVPHRPVGFDVPLEVIFGSRAFVDGWFEENRSSVNGRSRTERKRGSKSLGLKAMQGLYAFRAVR